MLDLFEISLRSALVLVRLEVSAISTEMPD
jgi:hypothetical protein